MFPVLRSDPRFRPDSVPIAPETASLVALRAVCPGNPRERGLRDAPRARRTAAGCFGAVGADIEAAADRPSGCLDHRKQTRIGRRAAAREGPAEAPGAGRFLQSGPVPTGGRGRDRGRGGKPMEVPGSRTDAFGLRRPAERRSLPLADPRSPEGRRAPGNALTALYGAPGAGNGAFRAGRCPFRGLRAVFRPQERRCRVPGPLPRPPRPRRLPVALQARLRAGPAPEHPAADHRCRRKSIQARLHIRRLRSECVPVRRRQAGVSGRAPERTKFFAGFSCSGPRSPDPGRSAGASRNR